MRRTSKKLREAAWILGQDWYGATGDVPVLAAVRAGRVSRAQIYRAVEGFGFRWRAGSWRLQVPAWLRALDEKGTEGDD